MCLLSSLVLTIWEYMMCRGTGCFNFYLDRNYIEYYTVLNLKIQNSKNFAMKLNQLHDVVDFE